MLKNGLYLHKTEERRNQMRQNKKRFVQRKLFFALIMIMSLWMGAHTAYAYDDSLYWDGTEAGWYDVDDAEAYQVRLYRDNTTVTTKEVSRTWYNFKNYMNQDGKYRFRVREIVDGEYGKWSSYSDYYTYRSKNTSSNKNYGSYSTQITTSPAKVQEKMVVVLHEGWQQDNTGWWYRLADGSYPKDTWYQIGSKWYNFDTAGYMRTGWIQRGPSWFYCLPSGEMAHGWHEINQAWYYFDENGYMLANTTTPDGYAVGADGARIQ